MAGFLPWDWVVFPYWWCFRIHLDGPTVLNSRELLYFKDPINSKLLSILGARTNILLLFAPRWSPKIWFWLHSVRPIQICRRLQVLFCGYANRYYIEPRKNWLAVLRTNCITEGTKLCLIEFYIKLKVKLKTRRLIIQKVDDFQFTLPQ